MADLDRLFEKIEKIDDRLSNIDLSLVRNTISLEEHVKRTNILEEEIRPIKKHVLMVEAIFKLIGVLSVCISVFVKLYEIWKK